jgi:uncharacterized membrane protein YtjA (UPF0391 family)
LISSRPARRDGDHYDGSEVSEGDCFPVFSEVSIAGMEVAPLSLSIERGVLPLKLNSLETIMLNLAITLFVLAIIAGVLGFGGMAGSMASLAQLAFGVFIVLFLISAVVSALKGRAPV